MKYLRIGLKVMIELNLKKCIYSKKNVLKAIDEYKNLCHIDILDATEKMILVFKECLYDEKLTVNEFENYVIGLENM